MHLGGALNSHRQLYANINESVSRINGKFGLRPLYPPKLSTSLISFAGHVEFSPIQSQFSSVTKEELTALYAASNACIVSSTWDGLNVVSLEYIACQQERHGVLLLSEFAEAAKVLDGAIKFNPCDSLQFADTIYEALNMAEDEKARRIKKLHEYVVENTRYVHFLTLNALQ